MSSTKREASGTTQEAGHAIPKEDVPYAYVDGGSPTSTEDTIYVACLTRTAIMFDSKNVLSDGVIELHFVNSGETVSQPSWYAASWTEEHTQAVMTYVVHIHLDSGPVKKTTVVYEDPFPTK